MSHTAKYLQKWFNYSPEYPKTSFNSFISIFSCDISFTLQRHIIQFVKSGQQIYVMPRQRGLWQQMGEGRKGKADGRARRQGAREVRRKRMAEERKREGRVGVFIETRTKASGGKAETAGEKEKWETGAEAETLDNDNVETLRCPCACGCMRLLRTWAVHTLVGDLLMSVRIGGTIVCCLHGVYEVQTWSWTEGKQSDLFIRDNQKLMRQLLWQQILALLNHRDSNK